MVKQPGQDRHVGRGQRVPAGAEGVQGLAVAEEDRLLVLLHDQLGAELDVGRAFRRDPLDDRLVRVVEELNDFQADGHEKLLDGVQLYVGDSRNAHRRIAARGRPSIGRQESPPTLP